MPVSQDEEQIEKIFPGLLEGLFSLSLKFHMTFIIFSYYSTVYFCKMEHSFDIRNYCLDITKEMRYAVKPNQVIKYSHNSNHIMINLDKTILRHMLINLISNALKFSLPDKIVEVTTNVSLHEIFLSIKDHGAGISKDDQKHLFKRHFRGQKTSKIPGIGLGLNIVAKYIEYLGGTIDFESKLKIGTTFLIRLPNSKTGKNNILIVRDKEGQEKCKAIFELTKKDYKSKNYSDSLIH